MIIEKNIDSQQKTRFMEKHGITVGKENVRHRDMQSKSGPISICLNDLPCFSFQVEAHTTIKVIAENFKQQPDLPGVILLSQKKLIGMISRKKCFEALGRPFGIEIYAKQKAIEFFWQSRTYPLILDRYTRIEEAVKIALARNLNETYDPIVTCDNRGEYALVDMHTILTAQCDLLENLYRSMQKAAIHDPLTQVLNRRGFFEAAEVQTELATRQNIHLSALMIDIDNFKLVNDVYGHFVGDQVIRTVAGECQMILRQTDLLGRFGGEEFIVLLINTHTENALLVAERIRERIQNMVIYVNGYQVSVTVSVGISQLQDAKGSLDNLLTMADQAMYAAKWGGRNQVILWNALLAHKVRQDVNGTRSHHITIGERNQMDRTDAARIYDETIEGWAKALELRDKETVGHAERVTAMTVHLARHMGIDERKLVDVRRGAKLHDIGKIAIPDSILFKAGQLTGEEWEIMRKHPVYAFELLSPITFLQNAVEIPYCHHEHWDGSGYPRGLKGAEIPLAARIFTIVDVWDALTTARCYRPAWTEEEVHQYIHSESGKLFDPQVVEEFFNIIDNPQS